MPDKTYFTGFSQETLNFLFELRMNNYKSWFEENRTRYQNYILEPMQQLVMSLSDYMYELDSGIDTNPKKIISRIYRDVRFSKDKTPYRANVWVTFKRPSKDWQDAPSYYFEINPEGYTYGMGFYMASKETMDRFRNFIETQPLMFSEFTNVYNNQTTFKLEGERYKRILKPKLTEEQISWYQFKNFYFVCQKGIEPNLFSHDLINELKEGFAILTPIYHKLFELK